MKKFIITITVLIIHIHLVFCSRGRTKPVSTSNEYKIWAVEHGVRIYTRYRNSRGTVKRHALRDGLILSSKAFQKKHRMMPDVDKNYYEDLTICFNEDERLYPDRNITSSPWFLCPWKNFNNTDCCGSKDRENCCVLNKWDRYSYVVPLVVVLIAVVAIYHIREKRKQKALENNRPVPAIEEPMITPTQPSASTNPEPYNGDDACVIEPDALPPPYESVVQNPDSNILPIKSVPT